MCSGHLPPQGSASRGHLQLNVRQITPTVVSAVILSLASEEPATPQFLIAVLIVGVVGVIRVRHEIKAIFGEGDHALFGLLLGGTARGLISRLRAGRLRKIRTCRASDSSDADARNKDGNDEVLGSGKHELPSLQPGAVCTRA